MLLGPVFQAELLRTSRRRRYYVMRFLFGLLLLGIIALGYDTRLSRVQTLSIEEAADFALSIFTLFAVVQLISILLLIPALFGGVIADEKQRKTLHYLMASQLSSFEIVIDKVLGRSAHVAVFLALGLPIVCLLGLIGGVPPEYVIVAYLGTFSTASMAIALTVLVSTVSRKVRQSVLISYIFLLAWQFVPLIVFGAGRSLYPVTYAWIEPVNAWFGSTSPLFVYVSMARRRGASMVSVLSRGSAELFFWMVGLQLATAGLLVLLAVWRLRPAFRRHEATQPRRKWFEGKKARRVRSRRWYDRPECGIDAMSWKERYFARTDVVTKLVVLPATILVTVVLVLVVGLDETILSALSDLWHWQRGANEVLIEHLRVFSAWYVAVWLLAVAGASASSVAVEREEDTWISLTSTPLTGWEIVRGKAFGALWAQRGFGVVPLAFGAFGVLTGAVHPVGALGALVAFALVSWMVVAVGIHASLRATTTSRAIAATIATLALLYGYPLFLIQSMYEYGVWDRYASFVGLPARVVVAPLASGDTLHRAWSTGLAYMIDPSSFNPYERLWGFGAWVLYVIVAAALTSRSVRLFDRWLDRPRITREAIAIRKPVGVVEEVRSALQS